MQPEKEKVKKEISELQQQLTDLDYLTNYYVEGKISKSKFKQIAEQRDKVRVKIKGLKSELENSKDAVCEQFASEMVLEETNENFAGYQCGDTASEYEEKVCNQRTGKNRNHTGRIVYPDETFENNVSTKRAQPELNQIPYNIEKIPANPEDISSCQFHDCHNYSMCQEKGRLTRCIFGGQ